MKRIVLALSLLLTASGVTAAQYAPSTENLRGLTGVRLTVTLNQPQRIDPAQRPEILKVVEAETIAKLREAGIPMFQFADEVRKAGYPRLVILIKLDNPYGFLHTRLETEVKLFQRVHLARDLTIETDAVTWSQDGVGATKVDNEMILRQAGMIVDMFIKDYRSVNPRQSVRRGNDNRE